MGSYLESLDPNSYNKLGVLGTFDIIVLGGGPAGIAAATTAAEAGHKTLLIERLGFCGGAAVSGMSGTICGLYNSVEDPQAAQPQQLIFGFAERMRSALDLEDGLTALKFMEKLGSLRMIVQHIKKLLPIFCSIQVFKSFITRR